MYPRIILDYTHPSHGQRYRIVQKNEFQVVIEGLTGKDSMGVEIWRCVKDMSDTLACVLIQELLKTFTPTSP